MPRCGLSGDVSGTHHSPRVSDVATCLAVPLPAPSRCLHTPQGQHWSHSRPTPRAGWPVSVQVTPGTQPVCTSPGELDSSCPSLSLAGSYNPRGPTAGLGLRGPGYRFVQLEWAGLRGVSQVPRVGCYSTGVVNEKGQATGKGPRQAPEYGSPKDGQSPTYPQGREE